MRPVIASLAVTGIALVVVVGIGASEARAQQTSGEPIPVGVIANLTGTDVKSSLDMMRGVELAVAEINAAGGINGRPIKLIIEDSEYRPQEALDAATKLYDVDKVEAAIMFGGSSLMIPVAEMAEQKGKVDHQHVVQLAEARRVPGHGLQHPAARRHRRQGAGRLGRRAGRQDRRLRRAEQHLRHRPDGRGGRGLRGQGRQGPAQDRLHRGPARLPRRHAGGAAGEARCDHRRRLWRRLARRCSRRPASSGSTRPGTPPIPRSSRSRTSSG